MLATGTLLTPNNTIDTTTGTISLKATFANNDDHLWPGQFVNTRVQVDTLHKAVTVPALAVQHGPDGLFVYVVKPDQTVAQANIQVGYQDGGRAVVTKGLSGNETVVVSGQSRLAPGTHVKATDASKTRAAGTPARPPRHHRQRIAQPASGQPSTSCTAPSAQDAIAMSISTPFIRRPIATSLLTAAIFLSGLVAYPLLPVAPLPNVQFPTLTVTAQYPGASPETMASTVATPLETEFGQMLPGLTQMTSASVLGIHPDHAAVRSQHRSRQRRNAGAGGDERRAGLAAEGHADPADVPRDQSGRQPDHDPGDAVGPGADHRGRQLRREPGRAADLAACRVSGRCWWAASKRRRSACRSIPRGWPRWA